MKIGSLVFAVVLAATYVSAAHAQSQFPCSTPNGTCLTVVPNQQPAGWIVGEIRTFAFGADSRQLINELAAKGWVEAKGQSAIRKDFDELWKVIGTTWGAADSSNVFYLPDLRGVFMRGWNDGRVPPPNHKSAPYAGDPDASARSTPRPEAGEAGGSAGASGDHVGSAQEDGVGPHKHTLGNTVQFVGGNPGYELTQNPDRNHFSCCMYTQLNEDMGQKLLKTESRPANVYVAYFIYVGKSAQILEPTAAEKQQGQTGRIVPANRMRR